MLDSFRSDMISAQHCQMLTIHKIEKTSLTLQKPSPLTYITIILHSTIPLLNMFERN